MMKLIKINEEHYVVKNNDGVITHSTDIELNEVYYIPLSEVKELIGEVDVEKKAHNWSTRQTTRSTDYWRSMVSTYVEAYNQALEDNKDKKYTEEDMRKAINTVRKNWNDEVVNEDEIIQHLQPKTEWEVEIINGKFKLV